MASLSGLAITCITAAVPAVDCLNHPLSATLLHVVSPSRVARSRGKTELSQFSPRPGLYAAARRVLYGIGLADNAEADKWAAARCHLLDCGERKAMTSDSKVMLLHQSQILSAGEVLARAFFHDPLMVYMLPDEGRRARLLPWQYGTLVRYGLLAGEVYTTSDCAGVAIWLLEREDDDDRLDRLEQSGILEAPDRLGLEAFTRFASVTGHLETLRRREMPSRYWYLPVVGVDPTRQGHGLGAALLEPILSRADSTGLACYLETLQSRNVPFYRRLGFEVVAEDVHLDSGLRYWTFRRDPRQ
jgi:GNAT superfamily N-acetyltransferase